MKRIVTVQDISCFGKCSLTVALPIISAMGVETCVVPTAVLSTHTGGFTGFTFCDLTDEMPKIEKHWKSIDLRFDAIYTGYLGSSRQISLVSDYFDTFGKDALKLVDPVMADHGKLYTGFTPEFAAEMAKLCGKADIIVPNLTEACFMLGKEYVGQSGYDRAYVEDLLKGLCGLGCKTAILTGVMLDGKTQGAVAYNSETGKSDEYFSEDLPYSYHGTGDVFASALVGALTLGKDMGKALKIAVDYTVGCMKATAGDDSHRYGVKFEERIPALIESLK